jgi:hypothetical protein
MAHVSPVALYGMISWKVFCCPFCRRNESTLYQVATMIACGLKIVPVPATKFLVFSTIAGINIYKVSIHKYAKKEFAVHQGNESVDILIDNGPQTSQIRHGLGQSYTTARSIVIRCRKDVTRGISKRERRRWRGCQIPTCGAQ